jgi:flagellar biosynthesis protein FlhG
MDYFRICFFCGIIKIMILSEKSYRKIIPVAGGKGGVGKSIFTVNLGLYLGRLGKRVILIDLDMGAANLHTCLGLKNTRPGLGNFVSNRELSLADIMYRTDYPNLFFIPGDVLAPGMADIVYNQKRNIISQMLKLEADYILLDLGAGSHFNVIDFFLVSNSGILVVTPQVPSLLNVYGFLKNLNFRFLQRALTGKKTVEECIRSHAREARPNTRFRMSRVLHEIEKLDRDSGRTARGYLKSLKPSLVVNMAFTPEDLKPVDNLRQLVRDGLNVDLACLGMVCADNEIDKAMKKLMPLALESPQSMAARQIERIAEKIFQSDNFPDMPLDFSEYKDSFELAAIEADNDWACMREPAATGGAEGRNPADMEAIIVAQQRKIQELQQTVRMLTLGAPKTGAG